MAQCSPGWVGLAESGPERVTLGRRADPQQCMEISGGSKSCFHPRNCLLSSGNGVLSAGDRRLRRKLRINGLQSIELPGLATTFQLSQQESPAPELQLSGVQGALQNNPIACWEAGVLPQGKSGIESTRRRGRRSDNRVPSWLACGCAPARLSPNPTPPPQHCCTAPREFQPGNH